MLKIIKCGNEFNLPRSSVVNVDTTYDGVLVTLRDNTEIRFTLQVSPQIKALMPIVQTSKAKVIKLDLDAAMAGRYGSVITLINDTLPPPTTVIKIPPQQEQKQEVKPTEIKIPEKKKGGRPKGSKTKKVTK